MEAMDPINLPDPTPEEWQHNYHANTLARILTHLTTNVPFAKEALFIENINNSGKMQHSYSQYRREGDQMVRYIVTHSITLNTSIRKASS